MEIVTPDNLATYSYYSNFSGFVLYFIEDYLTGNRSKDNGSKGNRSKYNGLNGSG